MTAALAVTETVLEIPLGDILPSRVLNYRRTFNQKKLEELADSMRQVGVLEPIVVRSDGDGGLELVFGERRLRAAHLAELATIKAIIRDYSDEQVRESRLIENAQREDADPLDESEAFAELQKLGYSPAGIAEKIGQSHAYVAQRLQLTSLSPACREALASEHISIGVAVLIAALPSSKLQDEALQEVSAASHYENRLMSVADARREIEEMVMMALADAPFKTDDPTLVPAAGACTNCPKRTGGQALLFADASSPDLCTDKVCFRGKQDAAWKLRQKEAKAAGLNVLGAKEGKAALDRLNYGDSQFTRLDSTIWDGKKHVKVAKLVGKAPAELTLARDDRSGLVVELVPRKLVEAAAKVAAPEKAEKSAPDARAKAEREAERLKAEVNRRAMTAIVEAADAAARQGKPSRALLRLAIRGALDSVWTDVTKKVADRRGLPLTDEAQGTTKKGAKRQLERLSPAARIERLLDTLDEGGLFALLLELAMGRSVPGKWSEGSECYVELCSELEVNPKGLETIIKAEWKAKRDGKGKPAGKVAGVPALVHRLALGSDTGAACGNADPGSIVTGKKGKVTCPKCKATPSTATEKPAPAAKTAKKKAAKKAEPRPQHPATGQVVHYIDTTGLSQTGVACGGKVGGGKGIVTDEIEKVTCKSCRRTAGLDAAAEQRETNGDDQADEP